MIKLLLKWFHVHKWVDLAVASNPWSSWNYYIKRRCKKCGKTETVNSQDL